jgi:uncharacterized membrane protein YqjE
MFVMSLIILAIAGLTIYLSIIFEDDVFQAAMAFTAALCTILALVVAPWAIKLIIVIATPCIFDRMTNWSARNL